MQRFTKRFLDKVMWSLLAVSALSLIVGQAAGQCELDKLLASDGEAEDRFGISVSISGSPGNEVAIVGALNDNDNGFASGSAYIYRYNGVAWVQVAKLLACDGAVNDLFGHSVSISGDLVIVGARLHDDNGSDSGAAYITLLPEKSGSGAGRKSIWIPWKRKEGLLCLSNS